MKLFQNQEMHDKLKLKQPQNQVNSYDTNFHKNKRILFKTGLSVQVLKLTGNEFQISMKFLL